MWLHQERPSYWKHEIRRRGEDVNKAKTEISRKIIAAAPEPASLVLERRALHRCQSRLEEAQKRLEKVKSWGPRWEREAMMYKGSTHGLSEQLHREIPLALARLEKMFQALEAYAKIAPPGASDVATDVATEVADAAPPGNVATDREP